MHSNAVKLKFLIGSSGLNFSPSLFEMNPKYLGCISWGVDGATESGLLLHLPLHETTMHLILIIATVSQASASTHCQPQYPNPHRPHTRFNFTFLSSLKDLFLLLSLIPKSPGGSSDGNNAPDHL